MKQKDLHWLGGMESSSTIWDTTYIANKLTSGPNTRIPSYLSFKPYMLIWLKVEMGLLLVLK